MSVDSWLGPLLLLAALALMVLAAVGEEGLLAAGRLRAKLWATTGGASGEELRRYILERRTLLSALTLAKGLAVAASTGLALFLVLVRTGPSWLIMAVTLLAAVVLLSILQGVATILVGVAPDRWLRYLAPFLPVVRALLGRPARLLVRPGQATPLEELLELLEARQEASLAEEQHMIRRIVDLPDTTAREIMVPRVDIAALEAEATLDDAVRLVLEQGKSRLPLYQGTIDNIVGVVYAKDLLRAVASGDRPDLPSLARPPYFVPETKKVDQLLAEMRQNRVRMAIVVDEYGGIAGLVTTEDLLEEIVGEMEDEYDVAESQVELVGEDEAIVDARLGLDAFNELFKVSIQSDDYDTVGGFLFSHLGKMASVGDEVQVNGLHLRVLSVTGRRIRKVRVVREAPEKRGPAGNASS